MNTIIPAALNDKQLATCKRHLRERSRACLEAIHRELQHSDNERYIDLAGSVHDVAEESVADLLTDLDLSGIDLMVLEVQDIEAALLRIANRSYGVCLDCGESIGDERLSVHPTAMRCRPCQQHYEISHPGAGHTSL
jgi:DnaK suppressor protein